jgi:hypothetical protein
VLGAPQIYLMSLGHADLWLTANPHGPDLEVSAKPLRAVTDMIVRNAGAESVAVDRKGFGRYSSTHIPPTTSVVG